MTGEVVREQLCTAGNEGGATIVTTKQRIISRTGSSCRQPASLSSHQGPMSRRTGQRKHAKCYSQSHTCPSSHPYTGWLRSCAPGAATARVAAAAAVARAAGTARQRTLSLACRFPERSPVQSRAPPTPPHSSHPRTSQSCPGCTLRRAPLPTASSRCMARRR